ncbi:MAG: endo-1,4-beta-xylanase [Pirellulales bacterium]
MGLMRLLIHDRDRIPAGGLDHVYICGLDDLPYFGRAYFSGSQLVVERNESDSGRVQVPWRIGAGEPLFIGTATLMEREQPYLLEVELARGVVNVLRNQLAQWEIMGLAVSIALRNQVLEATSDFSRSATMQNNHAEAADWAERSLATSVRAMNVLSDEYVSQSFELRRALPRPSATWLGIHLGQQLPPPEVARQLPALFNMASVPFTWRRIEAVEGRRDWEQADAQIAWARGAGLKVTGGPILELDDRGLPDWTYLWEGDTDSLLGFMLDHVRAVVERYRSRVHLWQVTARMTRGRALALDEDARLQITARAIAKVRELDPTTPVVVTFDEPWADYLAGEQLDLAPLHFADALVRADLGLSGLGLELNVGYHPGATIHRSPLAYSRLIDTWSLLDLPLFVTLSLPSSANEDPKATGKVHVLSGAKNAVTPESQRDWIERHVPLFLSRSQVQVIVWNQLSDALPHHYPHGGLFDADNKPKPALAVMRKIREKYFGGK